MTRSCSPRRRPRRRRRSRASNLVEDITDLYADPRRARARSTRRSRASTPRARPARTRRTGAARSLPAGPHHYLVQFVGPIKDAWLRGVKRAGGEPRQLWENFTYVVRADDAAIAKIAALPYVRWSGHLPYDDRLAESVRKELEGATRTRCRARGSCPTSTPSSSSARRTSSPRCRQVRKLGVKVVHQEPKAKIIVVETSDKKAERQKQLKGLSTVHGVRKVRQRADQARRATTSPPGSWAPPTSMGEPGPRAERERRDDRRLRHGPRHGRPGDDPSRLRRTGRVRSRAIR